MSFSEDVFLAREDNGSFFPVVVLSGETAIPVTVTVTPLEFLVQSETLRATGRLHSVCVCVCVCVCMCVCVCVCVRARS